MPLFLDQEMSYSKQEQANVLSLFEVGVVFGAVILGLISDYFYSRRSPICMMAIFFSSILCFVIAFRYKDLSHTVFSMAMFCFGFFLGSTQHLINISAAADIGRQIQGKRATSTITGIIDACGNTGAGIG